MTGRFWQLLTALYLLIFLGLATLQGSLLAMAIPLLLYLGVAVLFAPASGEVEAQRSLEEHTIQDDRSTRVHVSLAYRGPIVDELQVGDELPRGIEVESGQVQRLIPHAGQEMANRSTQAPHQIELSYQVRAVRGSYTFEAIQVHLRETFGLFERQVNFTQPDELNSLPIVSPLRSLEIRPPQTRGFSGPIPARKAGSGISFFGVREYQFGDVLRHINWKLSSRRTGSTPYSELFTNEFEGERITDVGLILDGRVGSNLIDQGRNIFDYSVRAAAALAETFLAAGHRVSFLTYGYGLSRVFPGYGKVQRKRILASLARARVGSNYALETFNYLPTRFFPSRSQLVVISPLGKNDVPAYIRLRRAGYAVLLISPDPVSFERRDTGGMTEVQKKHYQCAARLAIVERRLELQKLQRLGVQIINWDVDKPLEQQLATRLGRQSLVRRNIKTLQRPG